MAKTNERTLKMMESFIRLHEEGLSVAEIAKQFNLSETTVYSKLGEIAKKAGVSRESLLEKPFEADHSGRNFTPVQPVDTELFETHFKTAMTEIGELKKAVNQAIEDNEIISEILEEDFRDVNQ